MRDGWMRRLGDAFEFQEVVRLVWDSDAYHRRVGWGEENQTQPPGSWRAK
jgi:hypothetical protein